jgi:hypothetical protein
MVKSADKLIGKKIIVVGGTSGSGTISLFSTFHRTNILTALDLELHKHSSMQGP